MKGISLPINMVVIIAVAVLVLVAMAAFFIGGTMPGIDTIGHTEAFNRGCAMAQARGCKTTEFEVNGPAIAGYNPDGDGNDDNILTACGNAYDIHDTTGCRNKCCGTGGTTTFSSKVECSKACIARGRTSGNCEFGKSTCSSGMDIGVCQFGGQVGACCCT